MEPNISLPAVVTALVLSNGFMVFYFRRAMAKRRELQTNPKRIWTYLVCLMLFIDVVTLGATGHLWQLMRSLLPA